jgi:hypothetical protein
VQAEVWTSATERVVNRLVDSARESVGMQREVLDTGHAILAIEHELRDDMTRSARALSDFEANMSSVFASTRSEYEHMSGVLTQLRHFTETLVTLSGATAEESLASSTGVWYCCVALLVWMATTSRRTEQGRVWAAAGTVSSSLWPLWLVCLLLSLPLTTPACLTVSHVLSQAHLLLLLLSSLPGLAVAVAVEVVAAQQWLAHMLLPSQLMHSRPSLLSDLRHHRWLLRKVFGAYALACIVVSGLCLRTRCREPRDPVRVQRRRQGVCVRVCCCVLRVVMSWSVSPRQHYTIPTLRTYHRL